MHVAMMLYPGFRLLEVTGPMDVFHEANRLSDAAVYEQHLLGPSPGPVLCSSGVAVGTTACRLNAARASFDIVVVPGSPMVSSDDEHRELVDWLSETGHSARRLASVSNGAVLIARAGLGDRHRLRDGKLYSSSGISGGIALALALVREDLGEAFARRLATSLSGPRDRAQRQAQSDPFSSR